MNEILIMNFIHPLVNMGPKDRKMEEGTSETQVGSTLQSSSRARMDKTCEKQRVMERKVVECEIVKIVQIM